MTYDTIYWLILGAAFVMTGLAGIPIMLKTEKILPSLLSGSAANLIITGAACWWWSTVFSGSLQTFSRQFGLFGLGVCFVNNEVLLFFALLIMKRKVSGFTYKPDHPDDL
ncbi:hypothetical protein LJK88_34520 [Paenibacillus sp. P26]|nr:hypothetical protein LJK88_34520 [Paenibacillus sp. P26]